MQIRLLQFILIGSVWLETVIKHPMNTHTCDPIRVMCYQKKKKNLARSETEKELLRRIMLQNYFWRMLKRRFYDWFWCVGSLV